MSLGDAGGLVLVGDDAEVTGHGVDAGVPRQLLRLDLVAHGADGADVGTDEDDAVGLQGFAELGLFRQEAVAGMDRLGAGALAGFDDAVGDQIALGGRSRADQHLFVGHFRVQRVGVGFGIDGDGLDAHAPRRLDDAAGDFTTVGDQDL